MSSTDLRRHAARDLLHIAIQNKMPDRALAAIGSLGFLQDVIEAVGINGLLSQLSALMLALPETAERGAAELTEGLRSCAHVLARQSYELKAQLPLLLAESHTELSRRLIRACKMGFDELQITPASANSDLGLQHRGIRVCELGGQVECIAVSGDGAWAVVGLGNPNLEAINLDTGERLYVLRKMSAPAEHLELIEGDTRVIAKCIDGSLWSWNLSTKSALTLVEKCTEEQDVCEDYHGPMTVLRECVLTTRGKDKEPQKTPLAQTPSPNDFRILDGFHKLDCLEGSQNLLGLVGSPRGAQTYRVVVVDCEHNHVLLDEQCRGDKLAISSNSQFAARQILKDVEIFDFHRDIKYGLAQDPSGNMAEFFEMSFADSGRFLIVARSDTNDTSPDSLCIYESSTGSLVGHLRGMTRCVTSISGSRLANRVVLGDVYGRLLICDIDRVVKDFAVGIPTTRSFDLSQDGRVAVAHLSNGYVRTWEIDSSGRVNHAQWNASITGVTFTGNRLVSFNRRGEIQERHVRDGHIIKTETLQLSAERFWPSFFVGIPNSRLIAIAISDLVGIFNIDSGECLRGYQIPKSSPGLLAIHDITSVASLSVSHDGTLLCACAGHGRDWSYSMDLTGFLQMVWKWSDGGVVSFRHQRDRVILCSAFISESSQILLGSRAGLELWDYERETTVWSTSTQESIIATFALSDNRRALAVHLSGRIDLIDVETGKTSSSLTLGTPLTYAAMNTDRSTLAVCDEFGHSLFLDIR